MGIAGVLALVGGRFGRRAAARGMASVAVTSPLVNLVLKFVFPRARPSLRSVPVVRRLARQPASTSFPSSHAASAFAFAVGVSAEMPVVAPPLGMLAATVAYSRVYVGVHYPSDVLAGAAIGGGIALLAGASDRHAAALARAARSGESCR
jgi:membrane-associated phospholipid phosphatase